MLFSFFCYPEPYLWITAVYYLSIIKTRLLITSFTHIIRHLTQIIHHFSRNIHHNICLFSFRPFTFIISFHVSSFRIYIWYTFYPFKFRQIYLSLYRMSCSYHCLFIKLGSLYINCLYVILITLFKQILIFDFDSS